jgi:signal transduction histidine kinase
VADQLIQEALELARQLELPEVLQKLVDGVAVVTGAKCCALTALDGLGKSTFFVRHGPCPDWFARATPRAGGHRPAPPDSAGGSAEIPATGLSAAFLDLPVRLDQQVFGRIYVAGKPGGFTADDVTCVEILAQAAGIAVTNCRLYGRSCARERWTRASQHLATTILEGAAEEDALQSVASQVREAAAADTCLLILPSVGDGWACEIADGYLADHFIGVEFPDSGRALTVLRTRTGALVDSVAVANPLQLPELRSYGPALYVPMTARESGLGVILLLRQVGAPGFEECDLVMAESLARQTARALELRSIRAAQDIGHLQAERQRIGRDLHDLAIQPLFAAGMRMEAARGTLIERNDVDLANALDQALVAIEESIGQIRAVVLALRERRADADLSERLRKEVSIARSALGFTPSLAVCVDGLLADGGVQDMPVREELASRICEDIADDVVAVVREGCSNAARHAHASSVQVQLLVSGRGSSGRVQVHIADDGTGPGAGRRSGIDNLAARAHRHQGFSGMTRNPGGRGTLLMWEVPLR